ncbi:MAG: hypothetical protein ACLQMF_01440 [Rectinemataceae bacterium]
MNIEFPFKLKSKHMMYALGVLGLLLIAMAVLGLLGLRIPNKVSSDVSNGVIIFALVVFFYSRKLRTEEAKAKAAAKEKEKSAALENVEVDAGPGA